MARYSGTYGSWQLDDLPGCSQVCVSHSAFILPDKRGGDLGNNYHRVRLIQIKEQKYDAVIATVDERNERQIKILTKFGWTKLRVFKSNKTGHDVGLWFRDVKQEEKL